MDAAGVDAVVYPGLLSDVSLEEVGAAAFEAGLELHELSRRDAGLERTFLDLTETGAGR